MKLHRHMKLRRWPRIYTVALIVMAIVWALSFMFEVTVSYNGGGGGLWGFNTACGEVGLFRWLRVPGRKGVDYGFRFSIRPPDPDRGAVKMLPGIGLMGFFAHHSSRRTPNAWGSIIIIPYWAIGAIILCGIGLFRYRQSRLRVRQEGFPVTT